MAQKRITIVRDGLAYVIKYGGCKIAVAKTKSQAENKAEYYRKNRDEAKKRYKLFK
jgi:hypothetical protein